jgi:GDP-L-fucose synthase
MNKTDKILVCGGSGMVGSAILRTLASKGYKHLLAPTSSELDARDSPKVDAYLEKHRPQVVVIAAARVGGILANDTYPADFIYDNLMIEANLIHGAHKIDAEKLLFLGSTCIYPKLAPQPLKEEYLLSGPLEPTNEWYAVAKIAGIKMCQAYQLQHGRNFISAMPTNLYGPNDNFDLEKSHVLPALMRKFHDAKVNGSESATVWGSGKPRREFLHVDDCAAACVYLLENYSQPEIVNIGVGEDLSILDLAQIVKSTVEFEGELTFDSSKPDGSPRKLVDVTKINSLGWKASISLEAGVKNTYAWFLEQSARETLRL